MPELYQFGIQRARGRSLALAFEKAETAEQSFYRWRKQHGLHVGQTVKMKDLERENSRLLWRVADPSMEMRILANVASGDLEPPSDAGRRWRRSYRGTARRIATPAGSLASAAAYNSVCSAFRPMRMGCPAWSLRWCAGKEATAIANSTCCCRQTAGRRPGPGSAHPAS